MTSKRICMVAYTHYRGDARPRREAEALAARGDEVEFIALAADGVRRDERLAGVRVIELPQQRYRGNSTLAYLRSYGRFFAQALVEVTRRHATKPYDVVWAHTMPDFIVFAAAPAKVGGRRLRGAKVVLDLHDTMPELYQSKFGLPGTHPIIRAIALQEKLACRFADHVVCVHDLHKQLLAARSAGAAKITPLLNLPDPAIFGPAYSGGPSAREPSPPRVVYHGTVAARLGLDLALVAFARAREHVANARFEIYGTGDAAPTVHATIRELGLGDSVHFPDEHFHVEAVPQMIADATAGVVPNRDDPATRLMLPVKLLEYVHLGVPALAPRLPAITQYFGDDALAYYEPGDVPGMAAAMARLLTDGGARARIREAAAAFSTVHNWEAAKQELYRVIDA